VERLELSCVDGLRRVGVCQSGAEEEGVGRGAGREVGDGDDDDDDDDDDVVDPMDLVLGRPRVQPRIRAADPPLVVVRGTMDRSSLDGVVWYSGLFGGYEVKVEEYGWGVRARVDVVDYITCV
jgi:hypothetical protein